MGSGISINGGTELRAGFHNAIFFAWLLPLIWAPLPRASVPLWAQTLLVLLVALTAAALLLQAAWQQIPLLERLRSCRWPLLLLLPVPLWATLQALPLPLGLLQALSPLAAEAWQQAGTGRAYLTLDLAATQLQAVWSWALWLYFAMAALLLDTPQRVRSVATVIVYCGMLQAVYGSFMTLSGLEYGFLQPKEFYRGVATGTFVNRNSFAGYLAMCLAVGIGLLVASLQQQRHKRWRDTLRRWLDTLLGAKMRLRVFLALMVIALVLTRSRMGNTAFFSSLLVCGLALMIMQRKLHKGAIILFASLLLVDFLIVGQWFGFEKLQQRLEATSIQSETRDEVARDTLVMIQDYPFTGVGLGANAVAFQRYQQPDVGPIFYDRTHNDYLQFSAELGLPVTLCLGAVVLLSLGRAGLAMYQRRDGLAKGAAFAGAMGITALLIHSTVDFDLQIPANALLFMVILMLPWVAARLPRSPS